MRKPTLYTVLPFYQGSTKHLDKYRIGYPFLKGVITPDTEVHPFQIKTVSNSISAVESVEAIEYTQAGTPTGSIKNLGYIAGAFTIAVKAGFAYIICSGAQVQSVYKNYALKIVYGGIAYYSELCTAFDTGLNFIPELADSYIIEANLNTAIRFYDDAIIIESVSNQGSAGLYIDNNIIKAGSSGTIAGLSVTDSNDVSYFFPVCENMFTIHCVNTGARAIVNNAAWTTNGFNSWNLLHGATKLTSSTGAVGFIPYNSNNEKLIVL